MYFSDAGLPFLFVAFVAAVIGIIIAFTQVRKAMELDDV
jgi:hypothetical protein